MQSLHNEAKIESYLESVRGRLGILPEAERAAELAEIRDHLNDLACAHTELGASDEEALQSALRQFGDPKAVGTELRRAWRRGQRRHEPGTLVSAVAWGAGATISMGLFNSLVHAVYMSPIFGANRAEAAVIPAYYGFFAFGCVQAVLTGFIVGFKAPHRAVAGMILCQAIFTSISLLSFLMFYLPKLNAQVVPMYMITSAISIGIGLAAHLLGVGLGRRRFLACQRHKLSAAKGRCA